MTESTRLEFIEARDGRTAAIAFAKQSAAIYRTCVLISRKRGLSKPHHASLPEYRRALIESYLALPMTTPEQTSEAAHVQSELIGLVSLRIRSLISDKEMVTAQANLDLARGGEWRCDYAAWHGQLDDEIQELFKQANAAI